MIDMHRKHEIREWDAKMVIARMIDAYKVLYDTTGRSGPAMYGAAWPEYQLSAVDKAEQQLAGTNSIGRMRARVQRNSRDCQRMDHVLIGFKSKYGEHRPWISEFLINKPGIRRCFEAHIIGQTECDLRNISFNAKKMCIRKGWAYSTFRARRNDGAQIIAGGLNNLEISIW